MVSLDDQALGWVRGVTGCQRIDVVRSLRGSSTGSLEVVALAGRRRQGISEQAVLRRYTKPALVEREPDLAA